MSEVNANILNRQTIKVSLQGKNGGGGAIVGGAEIDENGHLIIILSDGRRIDCGKVSGDVSDAQIAEAVEKYLSENPIEVNEMDPTVPEWAKKQEKPKYTAEEVGAQPKGDYALKSDIPAIPEIPNDVVKYSKQELGEEQQAQARENIGAASQQRVDELSEEMTEYQHGEGLAWVDLVPKNINLLDGVEWTGPNRFRNRNGIITTLTTEQWYTTTDFVPVTPGATYTIACAPGKRLYGRICLFSDAQNDGFDTPEITFQKPNDVFVEFSIPDGITFIGVNMVIRDAYYYPASLHHSTPNIDDFEVRIPRLVSGVNAPSLAPMYEAGYYLNGEGELVADERFEVSDYVCVMPGRTVLLNKVVAGQRWCVHLYDRYKEHMRADLLQSGSGGIYNFTYKIPYDTHYIRVTRSVSDNSGVDTIVYKDGFLPHDEVGADILNKWLSGTYGKAVDALSKATSELIVCIIDDDTVTADAVNLFKNTCNTLEIPGTYACVASRLESVEGVKDALLAAELDGHGVVLHADVHDKAMYEVPNDDRTLENVRAIYADVHTALRRMKAAGFTNCDYWCTPFGATGDWLTRTAKKAGLKCIVSSGSLTYQHPEYVDRFAIQRISLNPADGSNTVTLAVAKELAAECAEKHGWLLITTHFAESGWDEATIQARFVDFVNYLKGLGYRFVTLQEGFAIKKPIFDLYDMF